MNVYEQPPPYSPSVSGTPVPPGYQTIPTSDTLPILHSNAPAYGTATVTLHSVAVGICPVCKAGILEDDYPCSAILLALFCIPCCGICCCLAMKRRRCNNCNALFQ